MTENEKLDLILAKLDKIDRLETAFSEFGKRLDRLENEFGEFGKGLDRVENEFGEFGKRLDRLENEFGEFGKRLDRLENEFGEFGKRLDCMENEHSEFGEKIDKLDSNVTGIKLTLENEIRTNIMRVAEGHQDLYRKLREATKIEDEKEMIAIRVNILETELRTIKERLDQIA